MHSEREPKSERRREIEGQNGERIGEKERARARTPGAGARCISRNARDETMSGLRVRACTCAGVRRARYIETGESLEALATLSALHGA